MEVITLGLSIGSMLLVPLGAIAKTAYTNDKRLTIIETNHLNFEKRLDQFREENSAQFTTLRNEQRDQTQKLDRIIERVL